MVSISYNNFKNLITTSGLTVGEDYYINDYLMGQSTYLCPVVTAVSPSEYDHNASMADTGMTIQQGIEAIYEVDITNYTWAGIDNGVIILYRDNQGNTFDFDPQRYGNANSITNSTVMLQYHTSAWTYDLKSCSIYDCDGLYLGRTDDNNYITITSCNNIYVGDNNTGGVQLSYSNDVHIDDNNTSDFDISNATGVTIGSYNQGSVYVTRSSDVTIGRYNKESNTVRDTSGATIGSYNRTITIDYSNNVTVEDNSSLATIYNSSNVIINNTQTVSASTCNTVTLDNAAYITLTNVTAADFNTVHNSNFSDIDNSQAHKTNGVVYDGTDDDNAVVVRSSDEGNTTESLLNGTDKQVFDDSGTTIYLPSSSVTPPKSDGKIYGMKDGRWVEITGENILVGGTSILSGMTVTAALEYLLNN